MKEVATFGGGCFWCTEAIFQRLIGVESVVSGYAGGKRENPSYEQVSTGATGHAEAVQVKFDPAVLSYERLLDLFWHLHDGTTLNRQGADIGTQYRSVIFYHDKTQKETAENLKIKFELSNTFTKPLVTEIVPFEEFYKAEDYHQRFYDANRQYPYCKTVIDPKIRKLLSEYNSLVKDEFKEK